LPLFHAIGLSLFVKLVAIIRVGEGALVRVWCVVVWCGGVVVWWCGVYVQYGAYVVRVWCICAVYVVCMWCVCGVYVVCMWCVCDVM
jgi:hypothetical protein